MGSALAAVVALLAGWFLGIEPRLTAASTANAARAGVEATNTDHAAVLAQLIEDSRDRQALTTDFNTLSASIPDGTAIPDFVNQLDDLAAANEVTLSGLTVADAQAYTPGATAASALITAQSLAALEVNVAISGDYDQVLQFVDGLQTGARLFLVTGITTQLDTDKPELVEASISGLVYVLVPPGSVVAPVEVPVVAGETEVAGEAG
jgi:Tfp pilus assembly protein PilO